MYCIQVPNGIKLIIAIFKCLRLWDVKDACSTRSQIIKYFHFFFFATFVLSLGVGALTNDDKDETVFLAAVAFGIGVHVARLFYVIWRKCEIFKFITEDGALIVANQEEFSKANKKVETFMKCFKFGYTMDGILITVVFLTNAMQKKLPLNISFPLNWTNNKIGYWVTFGYVFVQLFYCLTIYLLSVILLYLMLVFVINYELLGNEFRRLGKQDEFHRNLIRAITSHRNIREKVDRFGTQFSKLFFIQLATSSICICGIVYSLAFNYHKNVIMTSLYIGFLIYFTIDIFTIMYLGNEVKVTSDKLSYCLFECNWVNQPSSCKKYIIILSEIVRQPHELVVGVLYPLNLETFLTILNLTYSMFNVLQKSN